MKRLTFLTVSFILVVFSGCHRKHDINTLKVISLNIRYENPSDSFNAWPYRASIIYKFLKNEEPDILGLQEVLISQFTSLDSVLTDYNSVGIGRDDGAQGGEMNPLFFKKERFELIRTKTFWLSDSSETAGSIAWGAGHPRIVTWAELADKITHNHFFFFNTHFAHDSDSARILSSELLLHKVDTIASGFPFIITGDFNMMHSGKGYEILTGPHESVPLIADSYAISEKRPVGPAYTFNGFSEKPGSGRIDYIFVKYGLKVLEHRTFIKKEHGIYISDHWPVMAVVALK